MKITKFVSVLNETNMYLVETKESGKAILIDPSDAKTAIQHINNKELTLDYIILTHEHYDHIAALNDLKDVYPDTRIIASRLCSERIQNPRHNLSKLFNIILDFKKNNEPDKDIYVCDVKPYEAVAADVVFEGKHEFQWEGHEFVLYEAPGHSKGSILIVADGKYLFSGDTVSYDYELITGFPGGSRKEYQNVTEPLLQSLNQNMKVYPGHGRVFQLKDVLL